MSQRVNSDGTHSLVCNYSNANTAADSSHVTWWKEAEQWELVEEDQIVSTDVGVARTTRVTMPTNTCYHAY